MGNRRVWAIAWRLSNGGWEVRHNLEFVTAASMFSYLWVSGVRAVYIKRTGVNPVSEKLH